ncbi:MAG: (Fe-S)-binding protein [Candidatus Electrothrix aestuarii]|uniref:(Fe-S)-binding protein n=1 Tax=Candidatus Electrothrix aestuarii TaxID=3062594 RepID=A0AAU8LZW1_9BACT|nr:(Fe-S)-binding protein [Candidatus Electrothrix aestuarii]
MKNKSVPFPERHAENCIECGLCVRECSFLQEYGTPKAIASSWQPDSKAGQQLPFACNLCGLCTAVCPPKVGLDPRAMFLAMRQQVVTNGVAPFSEHKRILAYEQRGSSSLFSCFALPKNCDERCDTVLFPGCAFAGTRPARLLELFAHLRQSIPTLGMVLSCCTKPSHDLGRSDFFHSRFGELRQALMAQGIRRVLVLCPSCHAVFKQYGSPLHTEYVYSVLAEQPLPEQYTHQCIGKAGLENITVHDPCTTRQDSQVHAAVRKLLGLAGLKVEDMPHHGGKTLCCGEGGAVPFLRKDLARHWGDLRQQEMQNTAPLAITYCAGCVDFLKSRVQIVHLLDLLFAPEATLKGRAKVARPPFTYLNRLLLKRRLKKLL